MIDVSRTAQNLRFDVPKQCLCSCALYRYFSIFLCHNKMNNKIKGFMENVGFVSFVLTWPKLFQPFQLHKSNWAYVVNTKFTSKKRNLASLRVTSKCYVIDHFTVVGLVSYPLSEREAEVGLVLIQTFFFFLWKLYSKTLVSVRTTWFK